MLTIRLEFRQVGTGELTAAAEVSEGCLKPADRATLLVLAAEGASMLRDRNQHNGSLVGRLTVVEDGRELVEAGALGVVTEGEALAVEGVALAGIAARHAAQQAKGRK